MGRLKPNQRQILDALNQLGGEASMREIASEADLDTNGVSQSIGSKALAPYVEWVSHEGRWRGGDERYRAVAIEDRSDTSPTQSTIGQELTTDQDSLF